MASAVSEHHLFIIWAHARNVEDRILADLEKRFRIIQTTEIEWSAALFAENMTRFYGQSLPPDSFKEVHVGTGPFLLVIVEDESPIHELVETPVGWITANREIFEAKQRYRTWSGGGHRIHATNDPAEFEHDLTLLLGRNTADFKAGHYPEFAVDDRTSPLRADLSGATGWQSLRHLFYVLNATVPYVVMRNFSALPDAHDTLAHGDIDLLVSDLDETLRITRAVRVFPEDFRVHVRVPIGDEDVLFDFRFVGDQYYDRTWQQNILANSLMERDIIRIPSPEDHLYSLLYHALIHKHEIAPDYVEAFAKLGPTGVVKTGESTVDVVSATSLLGSWLIDNWYSVTRAEPSVRFNEENSRLTIRAMWKKHPIRYVRLVARGKRLKHSRSRLRSFLGRVKRKLLSLVRRGH